MHSHPLRAERILLSAYKVYTQCILSASSVHTKCGKAAEPTVVGAALWLRHSGDGGPPVFQENSQAAPLFVLTRSRPFTSIITP